MAESPKNFVSAEFFNKLLVADLADDQMAERVGFVGE